MATLATLAVRILSDVRPFTGPLAEAQSALGKFGKQISTIAAGVSLSRLFDFAVSSIGGFVREAFDAVDSASKLASRLGVLPEQLVGWQHAADLAGVSSEQLETALQKLAVRLGEATVAGSEANRVFAGLGLDANVLAAEGLGSTFERVVDTIANLPDAASRAAAAVQVFGRSGAGLLNFFADGRKGLAEMRQEAELLGLTFNREAGLGVERFNDSLSRIRAIFVGIGRTAAITVAPILEEWTTKVVEFIKAAGGVRPILIAATDVFISSLAPVLNALQDVQQLIADIGETLSALNPAPLLNKIQSGATGAALKIRELLGLDAGKVDGTEAVSSVERLGDKLMATWGGVKDFISAPTKAGAVDPGTGAAGFGAMVKAGELIDKLSDQLRDFGSTQEQLELAKLVELRGVPDGVIQSARRLTDELGLLRRATDDLGGGLNVFDEVTKRIRILTDAVKSGDLSTGGLVGGLRKIRDDLEKATKDLAKQAIAGLATPLDEFEAKFRQLIQLSQAFDPFGKPLLDAVQLAGAVDKLMTETERAAGLDKQVQLPGAALKGTREEAGILAAAMSQKPQATAQERMASLMDALNRIQKEHSDRTKSVLDLLGKGIKVFPDMPRAEAPKMPGAPPVPKGLIRPERIEELGGGMARVFPRERFTLPGSVSGAGKGFMEIPETPEVPRAAGRVSSEKPPDAVSDAGPILRSSMDLFGSAAARAATSFAELATRADTVSSSVTLDLSALAEAAARARKTLDTITPPKLPEPKPAPEMKTETSRGDAVKMEAALKTQERRLSEIKTVLDKILRSPGIKGTAEVIDSFTTVG